MNIWIHYRLPCLRGGALDPTYPATYPAYIYIYIYISFFACFCHLYAGPIRGTSARQNGDFSFSYSLLLLPLPSLTPSPTPGPTPSSPTLILIHCYSYFYSYFSYSFSYQYSVSSLKPGGVRRDTLRPRASECSSGYTQGIRGTWFDGSWRCSSVSPLLRTRLWRCL